MAVSWPAGDVPPWPRAGALTLETRGCGVHKTFAAPVSAGGLRSAFCVSELDERAEPREGWDELGHRSCAAGGMSALRSRWADSRQ